MRNGVVIMLALVSVTVAQASVTVDFVDVGHAGNPNDTEAIPAGAVAYDYAMGTYEVTAGQYTEFLNAVAATDTYGLYALGMDLEWDTQGCNIIRSGESGSYTYSGRG